MHTFSNQYLFSFYFYKDIQYCETFIHNWEIVIVDNLQWYNFLKDCISHNHNMYWSKRVFFKICMLVFILKLLIDNRVKILLHVYSCFLRKNNIFFKYCRMFIPRYIHVYLFYDFCSFCLLLLQSNSYIPTYVVNVWNVLFISWNRLTFLTF